MIKLLEESKLNLAVGLWRALTCGRHKWMTPFDASVAVAPSLSVMKKRAVVS